MSKTKSIDDYAAEIRTLHIAIQEYPESETLRNRLGARLGKWQALLDITVLAASNERKPWQDSEIGLPIEQMYTKDVSGFQQVGDYHFYLNDYNMFGGACIERKGVKRENGRMISCDLYSSFAKKDNRRRFYAEVERFKLDPRFDQFVLIAECSRGEFLSFKPAFNGKNYNKCNYGMNVPARRATLARLMAMGVYVDFAGTRTEAIESYRNLIVQWCRTRYKEILNIE